MSASSLHRESTDSMILLGFSSQAGLNIILLDNLLPSTDADPHVINITIDLLEYDDDLHILNILGLTQVTEILIGIVEFYGLGQFALILYQC